MSESMWGLTLELTRNLYFQHKEKLTDEKEIIAWDATRKCERSPFKISSADKDEYTFKVFGDGFLRFSDGRCEQYHIFHNCKISRGETQSNIIADVIHQSHIELCDLLVEKMKQDSEIVNIYALNTHEWYNMMHTDDDKLSSVLCACKKSVANWRLHRKQQSIVDA